MRRRVQDALTAKHGPGTVPFPSPATFNRLVEVLSAGRHTFGAATTRRSQANLPATPFTPTSASRPGEVVQIDSTPLDVMAALDDGVIGRVELTTCIDIATRTLGSAVLRPVATKAVDAALLLARMLVPEPMRPGWPQALAMTHSRLPHARLVSLDVRLEQAAARPVIVPETIACDRGKVFLSDTFLSACRSCRPARPWASRCSRPGRFPRRIRPSWNAHFAESTVCSASTWPATPAPTSPAAAPMWRPPLSGR